MTGGQGIVVGFGLGIALVAIGMWAGGKLEQMRRDQSWPTSDDSE